MTPRASLLLVLPLVLLAVGGCRTSVRVRRVAIAPAPTPAAMVQPADVPAYVPTARRLTQRRFSIELEAGPTWQTRNEVALPGDTGTRFELDQVTGAGPFPWSRVTFDWRVAPRHGIRLVAAPFSVRETGSLDAPVRFDGFVFAPGAPTRARYKFNSYRLTYRYLLACGRDWKLHVGATAKIRDAEIELVQAGLRGRTTDLGFVPLLHVDFEKRLGRRWRFVADLDGAAAPQGRAFDLALKFHYDINARWSVGFGYRTLEGGADNDEVYTFAWLHQALVSVSYRF